MKPRMRRLRGLNRAATAKVEATMATWDSLSDQGAEQRLQKRDAADIDEDERRYAYST